MKYFNIYIVQGSASPVKIDSSNRFPMPVDMDQLLACGEAVLVEDTRDGEWRTYKRTKGGGMSCVDVSYEVKS